MLDKQKLERLEPRFDKIAEYYYKKKKYKEYAQAMAHYSLLGWVLGEDNEWEDRFSGKLNFMIISDNSKAMTNLRKKGD